MTGLKLHGIKNFLCEEQKHSTLKLANMENILKVVDRSSINIPIVGWRVTKEKYFLKVTRKIALIPIQIISLQYMQI